jgi:hypothetical protein
MIEFDPIIKRLPFRYKCLFIAYTLPVSLYIGVLLLLCSLNPFWFRQAAFQSLYRHVQTFSQWRNRRMQKYYEKYSIFNTIKTGKGI